MTETKARPKHKRRDSMAQCGICTSPAGNGRATAWSASSSHTPSPHSGSCRSVFCIQACILSGSSRALCLLVPYPEVEYLHRHLPLSAQAPPSPGRRAGPGIGHRTSDSVRAVPGSVDHWGFGCWNDQSQTRKTKRRRK